MNSQHGSRQEEAAGGRLTDSLIAILVLGSLWGQSEVVLGSVLAAAGVSWRSALLTGIGMGLVGIAAGALARRRFATLAAIPVIAVACKQLVVPILGVSPLCKANSSLAVLLQGAAIAGTVTVASRPLHKSTVARIAAGAMAAFGASIGFFVGGMQLAPCNYLLSFNRPGGLLAFIAAEGVLWAALSALLFPLGYAAGVRIRNAVPEWRARKPWLYYGISTVLVACSWITSGIAIAAQI